MGSITYTAVDRGEIQGGHTAGSDYTISSILFQGFPRRLNAKVMRDEAQDGTPESYLFALQREYAVRSDLVLLADRPKWREFFSSVLNAETFQISFDGVITLDVFLLDTSIDEEQVGGIGVMYSFRVRELP